jgi:hypothetical protein
MPIAGAQVIVLFRAHGLGRHVILLPGRNPAPEALGAGEALIRKLEQDHRHDRLSAIIPVSGAVASTPVPASERARWARTIAYVQSRPVTRIGDAGTGRWGELVPATTDRR